MSSVVRLRRFFKNWQALIVLVGAAIWTAITAGTSAWWTVRQYDQEMADRDAARKLEAQKPFLQKKLDVYFSAIQAARKLTDPHLDPDSQEWKQNATLFFELRWGNWSWPAMPESAKLPAESRYRSPRSSTNQKDGAAIYAGVWSALLTNFGYH
jgi:hypothetical protein